MSGEPIQRGAEEIRELWRKFHEGMDAAQELENQDSVDPIASRKLEEIGSLFFEFFVAPWSKDYSDVGLSFELLLRGLYLAGDLAVAGLADPIDAALVAECNAAWRRRFATRQRRNEVERLRRMPYGEYLQTQHWKDLREMARKLHGVRCHLCNKKGGLHTHHRSYANRGDPEKEIHDLILLCEECHGRHHDKLAR